MKIEITHLVLYPVGSQKTIVDQAIQIALENFQTIFRSIGVHKTQVVLVKYFSLRKFASIKFTSGSEKDVSKSVFV